MKTLLRALLFLVMIISFIGIILGAHHQIVILLMSAIVFTMMGGNKQKPIYRRTFELDE